MRRDARIPIPQLESALARAIAFLARQQKPNGEFAALAAEDECLTQNCQPDSSLFVTALVLDAIGWCKDSRVSPMLQRGLDFLESEMKQGGVWSYWSSRNENARLIPPDLDDTCCIAALMFKHGRALANNKPLILGNRDANGLYYTWLAARPNTPNKIRAQLEKISDPDVALVMSLAGTLDNIDGSVNANVVYYLGDIPETRAAVEYLIETVQQDQARARSTYYSHPLSFYYFLARAYANGVTALEPARRGIVTRITSSQADAGSNNPLLTALAACTLLNFNIHNAFLERAVNSLLQTQNADGSWMRHAMFLGPAPYYGSEELTTAFCVQALTRFHHMQESKSHAETQSPHSFSAPLRLCVR